MSRLAREQLCDGLFLAPVFVNIPDGLKTLPWAVWSAAPRPGNAERVREAIEVILREGAP